MRVGIHSGPVLLGAGPEADRTAMGLAVHLAARMEQSAPVGVCRYWNGKARFFWQRGKAAAGSCGCCSFRKLYVFGVRPAPHQHHQRVRCGRPGAPARQPRKAGFAAAVGRRHAQQPPRSGAACTWGAGPQRRHKRLTTCSASARLSPAAVCGRRPDHQVSPSNQPNKPAPQTSPSNKRHRQRRQRR